MSTIHTMFKALVLLVLRFYKRVISPVLPRSCRFYPTCSEYTMQAVEHYGVPKGLWMGVRRIGRCHPWNPGGYDPVPLPQQPHQHTPNSCNH